MNVGTKPDLVDKGHDPGAELVDLVDEINRVVGQATRREVRRHNLLHRGVGIICFNSKGQVYVHRRTSTKDVFPDLYDMFVGGVVSSGESYEAAARREIAEELGIEGPNPEFLFAHLYIGDRNRSWIYVYQVVWDGSIRHQPEEVVWGSWVNADRIHSMVREVGFVPDGEEIFLHLMDWTRQGGGKSRLAEGT